MQLCSSELLGKLTCIKDYRLQVCILLTNFEIDNTDTNVSLRFKFNVSSKKDVQYDCCSPFILINMGAKCIRRRIIHDLLLRQGIEANPGPKDLVNLTLRTNNCNGLGNPDKLHRFLIKCRSEVNKGGIIMLQETH